VVIAPNNDPGTEDIFAVLEKLPPERFRLIPSMRFNYFSELMKNAAVMVGNSSAGVREAPFLGLPSLDVGTRQNNRAQAESVVGCTAFAAQDIAQFLSAKWAHRANVDRAYGLGLASEQFVNIASQASFWQIGFQK